MITTHIAIAALLHAAPAEVTPDRPDVANGTHTVAPGAVQAEVGLEADLPTRPIDETPLGVDTSVRIGIHERAELRLLEGDLVEWATLGASGDGRPLRGYLRRVSQTSLDALPLLEFGGKMRITEADVARFIPSLGVQPVIAVRPPGRAFRGLPVLGLTWIVSQPLGRRLTLDFNSAFRFDGNLKGTRSVSTIFAASFGVLVHEHVIVFGELVGLLAAPKLAALSVDAGVIARVAPRLAFDIAGRATPIAQLASYGFTAGITAILADFRRMKRRKQT